MGSRSLDQEVQTGTEVCLKVFGFLRRLLDPMLGAGKTECSVLASSYRDLISGREDDLTVRVCLKVGLMLSVRFGLVQEGYFLKTCPLIHSFIYFRVITLVPFWLQVITREINRFLIPPCPPWRRVLQVCGGVRVAPPSITLFLLLTCSRVWMRCWSIGGFEITRSRSANRHRGLLKSFWIFKTSARPHARSRKNRVLRACIKLQRSDQWKGR